VARVQPRHLEDRRARRRAAVTVQAAEVSQALATGVIDSYMSSGATGFDSKTYESIKNWYDTQAWLPKNAIIVNRKAFDALDKPTQQALLRPRPTPKRAAGSSPRKRTAGTSTS
jgi:TRAP-type C4-dicarboxylate transport system substrate-binding protein